MKQFVKWVWCLLFGHNPIPVTFMNGAKVCGRCHEVYRGRG